jgi:hypothetical protein
MSAFNFGILAGLAFGTVSVAMMLPVQFPAGGGSRPA